MFMELSLPFKPTKPMYSQSCPRHFLRKFVAHSNQIIQSPREISGVEAVSRRLNIKGFLMQKKISVKPKLDGKIWRCSFPAEAPISDCGGAEYARDKGIPVILFPQKKGAEEVFSEEDLVIALRSYKVDFILLAGYLKLIPTELIKAYQKAILNIHPSLLPAFGGKGYYGMKVHKAVIAYGARYSGPTIHYVDEEYDTGRILAQRIVPVLAKDTAEELAARVLDEEHKLYVEVCAALCEERITWREDGVPLIRSKENPNDYH